MLDRYAIFSDAEQIKSHFQLNSAEDFEKRYNAYPTLSLPIITNADPKHLSFIYWGAPPQMAANKPLSVRLFNVATPELGLKPIFKKNLMSKRCIVPANGVFVMRPIGKRKSVPTYIESQNNTILGLAGMWEQYEDIGGKVHRSFTLFTTPTSDPLLPEGFLWPTFIQEANVDSWLTTGAQDLTDFLPIIKPISIIPLRAYPVTPKISDNSLNSPSMLTEIRPADQFGNYTLFN